MTAPLRPARSAEQVPAELVDDIVATREAVRDRARALLGVTGARETVPFGEIRRRYGLSYYPLVALSVLLFTNGLPAAAFAVMVPDISRTLGMSTGTIAAAGALLPLTGAIAAMTMAWRSQRGRRVTVCIATAMGWSVVTLLTGLVTTVGFISSYIALSIVLSQYGNLSGSVTALHLPILMDSFPPEARVRAVSTYQAASYLALLGGPLVVAVFTGPLGLTWRAVFVAMGLASLALNLIAARLREPGCGHWDTEQVRASVHQAKGEPSESVTPRDVELGFWEIIRRLTLVPTLRRVFGCFVLAGILAVPLSTFLSFFLAQRWNLGATPRGLFFAYYAACGAVSLAVFGRSGEKLFRESPDGVPRLIGVLLVVGVVFVALGGMAPNFAAMLVCFAISGAAFAPLLPALYISSLSVVSSRMRPHAQALSGVFLSVGGFVGAVFFAGIDRRYGIGGSLVAVAVPGLIGAWVIAGAGRHITGDLDRMIDEIVEDEEIRRIRSAGGHLPMLACRSIDFSYGQLQVLFDVDFTVDEGEMVALLGVNGAGKSTLLKVISGIGLPSAGSVRFRGEDISYLDAERRLQLGITQIPGGRAVFPRMTVVENLRSFGYTVRRDRRGLELAIERCFDAFPRLAERRESLAGTLSGGEQQMLGLSKALILRPRLLLIDELSLGLAPVIVGRLLDMVRAINADGTAVVLVEQSANIALNLVHHAYFMEKGEMRFDGRAADLLTRDDLLRAVFLQGVSAGVGAAQ